MAEVKIVPGKAQYQKNCICIYNIDVSSGGCPIALNPEGEYKKELACTYCYAGYLHKNHVTGKTVNEKEWKKHVDKMTVDVMRIGKNLEPGHPKYRDTLYTVMRLNNKHKLKTILITKMLEFDPEMVKLLLDQKSTVHFSMGNEHMEKGAVLNGCNNAWRLATARKYAEEGVITYLRIVEDITRPMRPEVKKWCMSELPILITPLRYNSKKVLGEYNPDADWDTLKNSDSFEYSSGFLKPTTWHADFTSYKERCGVVAGIEHCNNCGLGKVNRRIINE